MTAVEFARLVKNAKRRTDGKWWDTRCPGHDDQHASLSFADGDYALVTECHAGCSREQIATGAGVTVADFSHKSNEPRTSDRRVTATYDYTDEAGALLYQVVRYEPKDFRCRRPDGAGGWLYNLDGVRVVPYRLHTLAEASRVFVDEGEKDTDALADLGLIATTNHGGAGKWREEHTRALVAAAVPEVIVLRDNDAAGESHQRGVAASCAANGLALVRVLDLPGLPPKGDVSDWITMQRAAGQTDDEIFTRLLALADTAPIFTPEPPPQPPPQSTRPAQELRVPDAGMIGIARDFATLYSRYLETPAAFLYFAFLTYFGSLVSKKITLDSELRPEPRLYVVLIGESADTRKSTALRVTDQFFRGLGAESESALLFGAGSAEGIAAELEEHPILMLHYDELKAFVDKARNEHSVLLPMVSTLFERGDYDNRVKLGRISVRDASLSMVAACTADTYATMFDQQFFAIGFLNRLWLVSDRSTARIAIPQTVPETELGPLRARVADLLRGIDQAYTASGGRPVPYRVTSGALEMFTTWYETRERSIFERRLDTYAHRLMILLAATSGRDVIDETIMSAVIALVRYQLDVRRECDPVDAENTIAAIEEKIRRALARGALKGRDLKRRVNYNRVGIWAWNTAVRNLTDAGEILRDVKADSYWLAPAVITPVITEKADLNARG